MTDLAIATPQLAKFADPDRTAKGEVRARVKLDALRTLWINTGTLCNIECRNCYIDSSPENDRLAYITRAEIAGYLDEIARDGWPVTEIGFTGGEPFMNPDFMELLGDALARGHSALVLTNAMQPMLRPRIREGLLGLRETYRDRLVIRVSLDHYTCELHDTERGEGSFAKTIEGIDWLACEDFALALAGRTCWGESEEDARAGYAALFAERGWPVDAYDRTSLVLFPEMDVPAEVPEIAQILLGDPAQGPKRRDVRVEPHGGEAEGRRASGRAALHAASLRSRLRDGHHSVRGCACRWRHVRAWRGQALPSPLRQVLRARRRQLLGLRLLEVLGEL